MDGRCRARAIVAQNEYKLKAGKGVARAVDDVLLFLCF